MSLLLKILARSTTSETAKEKLLNLGLYFDAEKA